MQPLIPRMVETESPDDLVQPGEEGPFRVDPGARAERPGEGLLGEVQGIVVVPDEAERGIVGTLHVSCDEFAEGRTLAALRAKNEHPVGCLRAVQ